MASRRVVVALLAAATAAIALARCRDAATAPERQRAEAITASSILRHIGVIADDSMRGRLTPSPELDQVAAYAAGEFRAAGLRPGFSSGYVQEYPVSGVLPVAPRAVRAAAAPPTGPYAPNVAGVLDGADATLRDQYVLLVAHMDHLGIRAPIAGDSIYNGADDNASGTAAVLELARAFGGLEPRPRRSLVFLLVSGEEEGFWGSTYYVAHPAVPLGQTVAALNLDMISRNARDSVLVIGAEASSLGETARLASEGHPELGLRPAARPLSGGSDHIPFARSGVPALCFFAGLHADYHRPSDEARLVDAEKAARIARLVFYAALATADAAARPAWIPGAQPAAVTAR